MENTTQISYLNSFSALREVIQKNETVTFSESFSWTVDKRSSYFENEFEYRAWPSPVFTLFACFNQKEKSCREPSSKFRRAASRSHSQVADLRAQRCHPLHPLWICLLFCSTILHFLRNLSTHHSCLRWGEFLTPEEEGDYIRREDLC